MNFFELYGDMMVKSILVHLQYVLISVSCGFIMGLVLGMLFSRIPKLSGFFITVISLFQTIPGIVFIGILFMYVGMRPLTVIIALSIYATFPVLKNTFTGIRGVSSGLIEAAKGCGMSSMQSLFKVELPLAMPNVMAGLRLSTIYTVSWTVLAAMIGQGGLGDFIYQGVGSNNNILIIAGAVPAAIMAITFGIIIDKLKIYVMPGRRKKGGRA